MVRRRDASPQTLAVLRELLAEPERARHGYDLAHVTGLASGTLYPILIRLEARGLLEARWEIGEGKPRHLYRLTADGRAYARERLLAADAPRLRELFA
jgi:PadR family transcriptional regulator